MITRRDLVGSGIGLTALAVCPTLAASGEPDILIVDPALLTTAPPAGAIAANGYALLLATLPRLQRWRRIDGFVGEADARMLAELVRFAPGLRWILSVLPAGRDVGFGRLRRPARRIIALSAWSRR